MKSYELIFLTKISLKDKKKKDILAALEAEIKKLGCVIKKKESIGQKALAYRIAKVRKALFFVWYLDFEKQVNFAPLEVYFNRNPDFIRYLFLLKEPDGSSSKKEA